MTKTFRCWRAIFIRILVGQIRNACSSPKTVFWLTGSLPGARVQAVKTAFWTSLSREAERYAPDPWKVMEKYHTLCLNQILLDGLAPVEQYGNHLWVCPFRPASATATGSSDTRGISAPIDTGTGGLASSLNWNWPDCRIWSLSERHSSDGSIRGHHSRGFSQSFG